MLAERTAEAARVGFSRLLVPAGTRKRLDTSKLTATLVEVGNLGDAINAMRRAGLASIR